MAQRRVWNEKMETLSREEMEKLRMEKLQRQLKYCYQNSEFYRKKYDEVGFKAEDIRTWEDFRKIPVLMTKEDERKGQEETRAKFGHPFGWSLCVPPEEIVVAKTTGGTSGLPTFSHSYTKNDLRRWNECGARVLWLSGFRPGDRVLYCFPLCGAYVSSGGLCISPFTEIGVLTIDAGMELPLERIFFLARLAKPNALLASPSFAESMIEKYKELSGGEIRELGLKKLLLTGEPGIQIPSLKKRIEEAFGGRWCDWIGPNGEGFCATCESEEFVGLHEAAPELSIACEDLVDPATKKPIEVKDGAIGEPVITSLEREGAPYMKYALGDIVQVLTQPCQCGYPGPGYRKKVLGRVEDLLIVDGVSILPAVIKDTVNSFVPRVTGAMRIVLTEQPPRVIAPLKLKLEHGAGEEQLGDLAKEMVAKIQELHGIRAAIDFVSPGTLERPSFKTPVFEKRY